VPNQQAGAIPSRRVSLSPLFVFGSFFAIWLVVGYLATIPVAGDHPYWRTLRAHPGDFDLVAEDVSFSATDKVPLKGWYIRSDGVSLGTVIIARGVNGNRSDMLSRAAFLVRNHYNTLLIDLRDHGESGGTYAGPATWNRATSSAPLTISTAAASTAKFRSWVIPTAPWPHSNAAAHSPGFAGVISDSAYISFTDMVSRATTLLAEDPERSFWERLGLRLAGFRFALLAVKPIYYLRTGIWLDGQKANALAAISRIGPRPILFIAGDDDKICPPQNARRMYDAALSTDKALLIVPHADHDTTYSSAPHLYESTVISFLSKN
jgi:fermentation-respiration switch protein FrsA (DUF1100 family)